MCDPPCKWVVRLAPRYLLDTRTWAEVTVRPQSFVKVNRQRERGSKSEKKESRTDALRIHIGRNISRNMNMDGVREDGGMNPLSGTVAHAHQA